MAGGPAFIGAAAARMNGNRFIRICCTWSRQREGRMYSHGPGQAYCPCQVVHNMQALPRTTGGNDHVPDTSHEQVMFYHPLGIAQPANSTIDTLQQVLQSRRVDAMG